MTKAHLNWTLALTINTEVKRSRLYFWVNFSDTMIFIKPKNSIYRKHMKHSLLHSNPRRERSPPKCHKTLMWFFHLQLFQLRSCSGSSCCYVRISSLHPQTIWLYGKSSEQHLSLINTDYFRANKNIIIITHILVYFNRHISAKYW